MRLEQPVVPQVLFLSLLKMVLPSDLFRPLGTSADHHNFSKMINRT